MQTVEQGPFDNLAYVLNQMHFPMRIFHRLNLIILLALGVFQASGAQQIVSWGWNDGGQTNAPPGLSNVVAFAGGSEHSLALIGDGTVVAWGSNSTGQTNIPPGLSNVVMIAGGGYSSVALKEDGTLVGWGGNCTCPTNFDAYQISRVGELSNIVAVSLTSSHLLALTAEGHVIARGNDLGTGATDVPPDLNNVVAVAAGNHHSVALTVDGHVISWGSMTAPSNLSNVVAITAGGGHGFALTSTGKVIGWGENWGGHINIPSDLSNVTAFATHFNATLALTRSGDVRAWGLDWYGNAAIPFTLSNVTGVAMGSGHALVLQDDSPIRPFTLPTVQFSADSVKVAVPTVRGRSYVLEHTLSMSTPWSVRQRFAGNGEIRLSTLPKGASGFFRAREMR